VLRGCGDGVASSAGQVGALAAHRQSDYIPLKIRLVRQGRHLVVIAEGHRQTAIAEELGDLLRAEKHVWRWRTAVGVDEVRQKLERFDRGWLSQAYAGRTERIIQVLTAVLPDPYPPPGVGLEREAVLKRAAGAIAAGQAAGQVAQVGPSPAALRRFQPSLGEQRFIEVNDLGVVVSRQAIV
jgi:hypothetical protein